MGEQCAARHKERSRARVSLSKEADFRDVRTVNAAECLPQLQQLGGLGDTIRTDDLCARREQDLRQRASLLLATTATVTTKEELDDSRGGLQEAIQHCER